MKVKAQCGHGGDGRVNRPPGGGEGMADQRREPMLQAALEVIVERGYADTRIADVARVRRARIPLEPAARPQLSRS